MIEDFVCYGDTDSVVGESKVLVNNEELTISDYFDRAGENYEYYDSFNNHYVKKVNDDHTLSVNENKELENDEIKYVMKHKVKKRMFRIKTEDKSVTVTEDHSLVVIRKGQIKSISPLFLKKDDIVISI